MKLRQKLVSLMAASVVVTSVPVVTMADSTNSLSIYNYKIKDTTAGFVTTSHVFGTTTSAINYYTNAETGEFEVGNVPKLEIKPEYNYNLSATQSAFLHLTEGSSFVAEAYCLYVDALNNGGSTSMYFDAAGKIVGSVGAAWDGQTAKQISDAGLLKINYDMDEDSVNEASVTIKVMDITATTINERKYESTIRMDFNGAFDKTVTYDIPFLAKVGGDKEVLAHLDGTDSFVSSKTFTLTGILSDKSLVATADTKTITVDNIEEIGEIRLDENQIGALKDNENTWIKIKLPSSTGLEFNLNKTVANIKATGKRGFFGQEATTTTGTDKVEVKYGKVSRSSSEDDTQVLLVKLPKFVDASAKGQVVLTGIFVEPEEKTAATGDVTVTVSEDLTKGGQGTFASTKLVDSTSLKVATIADYGLTLKCEPVNVKAGRSGVINDVQTTFTLKENVKDTLVANRKIDFTLENGYIFGAADLGLTTSTSAYTTNQYKAAAKARFQELIADETIKFEKDAEDKDGVKGFELVDVEIDADGYVVGFTGRFDRLDIKEDNEIKVTLPVAAPVQAKGEVKVVIGNLFTRTYEKDVEGVVANIVSPIEVEVENAAIKVGLQDQVAGKVTIKETDKGMIERGWLYLSAEDLQDGITFDAVPTVTVKGTDGKTFKVENVQLSKNKKVVALEVVRTSTEASSIEITDIKFTADRTVPEANYDLQIWGDALTDENVLDVVSVNHSVMSNTHRSQYTDMYVVEDFITMTTKNTQDISAEGLKAATATFVIGESQFTVNGENVAMDSAAYIKDSYTMVPVKYVAKAFGIEGNAIQYDQATSTATIIAGNKVIAITAGKANIIVNGTQIPMATKAEVKDGRMCVPMAYIAAALNVEKSWDAATKTATFTNQSEAK